MVLSELEAFFKHASGEYVGGHAVSIVGYNDRGRNFIVRNSWGRSWGENGFARISYDDTSALGSNTWSYRVDVSNLIFAGAIERLAN